MNLKTFLSVLLVYRSNFHVLHWMADGDKFFTIHSKAEEYCNMILEDVDVVAEMHLRLEDDVVNYAEACQFNKVKRMKEETMKNNYEKFGEYPLDLMAILEKVKQKAVLILAAMIVFGCTGYGFSDKTVNYASSFSATSSP